MKVAGYQDLQELALNLIWSWNPGMDEVWKALDPDQWELTHNPWSILQTVSSEKLQELFSSPSFRDNLKSLIAKMHKEEKEDAWFQKEHRGAKLKLVCYFSMEYMLSEALPIYSGGLGNVAGDGLKAASDLGLPLVGIGLLYQEGYFRQTIDKEGKQEAIYPYNDPGQLPIRPLRKKDGQWLRIPLQLPGFSIWLRAWEVKIGKVKLFLLDSNDPLNTPIHRGITSQLYGGDKELRLQQELILGIGGWKLLQELGLDPEVCHLNEGHAAFAVLQRAKAFMDREQVCFEIALAATKVGNLFTTHTAVAAGFDLFPEQLLERYVSGYAEKELGISLKELLALGKKDPQDRGEFFNMAYLAAKCSRSINGVSQLHAKVSRQIFSPLFPRRPIDEIPIGYVTNGVHMPSWDCYASDRLWKEYCGEKRWMGKVEDIPKKFRKVPDDKIWELRNYLRKEFIDYLRIRAKEMWEIRGCEEEQIEMSKSLFNSEVLTLGFARRFATYKRPNMLLHDPNRLIRILTNPKYPVQLVIAGKAHPADTAGQAMIQQWIQFIRMEAVRPHVIFLSDYDMLLTERLVQGVDVWINTPRRPWEACGTSGMKVLVNGGLNLSELDGWWQEAYSPEVGWALGDGKEHDSDSAWDTLEAEALYELLENRVIPEFYEREGGIPKKWVSKIRESMSHLTPHFSANRAVCEYTEKHYLPAAEDYLQRALNHGAKAKEIVVWHKALDKSWSHVTFKKVEVKKERDVYLFEMEIDLDGLFPGQVKVEMYLGGEGYDSVRYPATYVKKDGGLYHYQSRVSSSKNAEEYTPRITPYFPGAILPLEAPLILWQK